MKVLFVTPHKIWPLTSGNRLRNYHLARQLAARASVTLAEMCYEWEQPSIVPGHDGFENLLSFRKKRGYTPAKLVRGIIGPTPIPLLNYYEPCLAAQLAGLVAQGKFDAVHFGAFHLSAYSSAIERAKPRLPTVIDWHNIESELMGRYSENTESWLKQLVASRTASLLERWERKVLMRCGLNIVVSERERDKLLRGYPSANIHVIPNGVDAAYFSPTAMTEARKNCVPEPTEGSLLFVGSMDYHANIDGVTWFAREAWPEIARRHLTLKLVIVGRDPAPAVRDLASDRIVITGTVEDVRPHYGSAVAVVVPLRVGGGSRLKILEAMAAGVPVISSKVGAEGLDLADDVHLLIADGPAQLIAAVDRLCDSPETRVRLARTARNHVIRQYDWSVVGLKLFSIYQSFVKNEA